MKMVSKKLLVAVALFCAASDLMAVKNNVVEKKIGRPRKKVRLKVVDRVEKVVTEVVAAENNNSHAHSSFQPLPDTQFLDASCYPEERNYVTSLNMLIANRRAKIAAGRAAQHEALQ